MVTSQGKWANETAGEEVKKTVMSVIIYNFYIVTFRES